MSQDWTANLYDTAIEANTTLTNMELMFATLRSAFSGTASPANVVPGQIWFDTDGYTWKGRNSGDTAWYGLMHGDSSQKVWIYRNAAMDGWAVDSGVMDKVLALKGGTTYTTGAATAGSWTVSGLTYPNHAHVMKLGYFAGVLYTGDDCIPSTDGGSHGFNAAVSYEASSGNANWISTQTDGAGSVSSDGTARTAAAVGTLQYLDLT